MISGLELSTPWLFFTQLYGLCVYVVTLFSGDPRLWQSSRQSISYFTLVNGKTSQITYVCAGYRQRDENSSRLLEMMPVLPDPATPESHICQVWLLTTKIWSLCPSWTVFKLPQELYIAHTLSEAVSYGYLSLSHCGTVTQELLKWSSSVGVLWLSLKQLTLLQTAPD